MNHRIYLFGVLGDGYTQYPSDYTQDYFTEFAQTVQAKTAIGVRRDGDILFYQYLRRMEAKGQYVGIAIAFNGVMLNDIALLFLLYENAITNLVGNGQLYKLNAEFARISEYLSVQLNTLTPYFEKLPPQNYALGKNSSKSFSIQDDKESIIDATRNYAKVYIIKDQDYDSESMSSFSAKLQKLNHAKEQAEKNVDELKNDLAALRRKQKNLKLVLLLFFVLIVGVIAFIIYAEQSNHTIGSLTNENTEQAGTINHQKSTISSMKEEIDSKEKVISRLTADTVRLYNQNKVLIQEKDRLNTQLNTVNAEIKQLKKENQEKQTTIANLRNQVQAPNKNSYSTTNTNSSTTQISGTKYIGANISRTTSNYDNKYALWFQVSHPLCINSFKVRSNKTGDITIGLYDSNHKLLSSCRASVTANTTTKITPSSFRVSGRGDYYLAIKSNNIELSYHPATSEEYAGYTSDAIQILGITKKGKDKTTTFNTYYQYFYEICYTKNGSK